MILLRTFCLAFIVLCLSTFNSSVCGEETIDVKDLPKEVTATVRKRYPKAKITDARKTFEDKEVVYQVDLTNEKKEIEMAVSPDGQIHWVAVELAVHDLPKVVVTAVRKKYPAGSIESTASVFTVKGDADQFLHYSVELTTKAGKRHELDVTSQGVIEDDQEISN